MARLAAGVRKRKGGGYEKRFTVNGIRYSCYAGSTKELEEKERELREQIEQGLSTKSRNITVDKYFQKWIEARETTAKGNTVRLYLALYNKHIKPAFGKMRVQDVKRSDVVKFQGTLKKKGLAIVSCNLIVDVLKMMLKDAERDNILLKSPAETVKPIKNNGAKASETYHRALTREEQAQFMERVKGSYYYECFAFMLCTGMRASEVFALNWNDIDHKRNVIHVTRTMTYDKDSHRVIGDSPKSKAGRRDIDMNDQIREILKDQRKKWKGVIPMGDTPVFITSQAERIKNVWTLNKLIRRTLDVLEEEGTHIDHFTCHALRDTFATRYIENGGSLQVLQKVLGHESYSMTADLYAHVLPDTKQKEMEKMRMII